MRNVDGCRDSGRGDECPRWCEGDHDEAVARAERLHRSSARSLPVVLWADGGVGDASAATVHVSVCRPGALGEDRIRLEADGLGTLDLDPSSAARLLRGVESTLRSLAAGA